MEYKIANRYALQKTIGQGGFGDVYQAEDTKSGQIRAIKMEKRSAGDLIFFESRVLQNLKDVVGVPRIHDFGFEGDFNYMVMDYCGYSLSTLLSICGGKFSLKTVCSLAIHLITILETVHNKYILHRDIKPENFLFFDPATKKFFLIDFGLSKRYIDKSGKHMPRAKNKSFRGTHGTAA